MDPLSITTGVLSLLGVCVSVSIELRKLKNGSGEAKSRISGLLSDVDTLRNALQSMEATLDELHHKGHFQTTGHIGAHWTSLNQSLNDGKDTLTQLETLVKSIDKSVSVLDGPRRYLRLKEATEQIAEYRQHVQSYRDTIQFSLEMVTFWNTAVIHEDTAELGAKVDAVDKNLQELSANLEVKLQALLSSVANSGDDRHMDALGRLQQTVRSAAIVLSDASTAAPLRGNDSDVGDGVPILSRGNTWAPDDHFDNWLATVVDTSLSVGSTDADVPPNTGSVNHAIADQAVVGASASESAVSRRNLLVEPLKQAPSTGDTTLAAASQHVSSLSLRTRTAANSPSNGRTRFWSRYTSLHKSGSSTSGFKVADPRPKVTLITSRSVALESTQQQRLLAKARHSIDTGKLPVPSMSGSKDGLTHLKAVCIGEGATGKTCFLVTFTKKLFPEEYIPTVFDNYLADATLDDTRFQLNLWDTAGQEDYDNLRPMAYPDAHVIFICFQVAASQTFDMVPRKWIAEVEKHAPDVPRMLIGLQTDLRQDPTTIGWLLQKGRRAVTTQEGCDMAEKTGCFAYAECSAKTGEGVDQAVETGLRGLMELWQMKGVMPQTAKRQKRSWLFGRR